MGPKHESAPGALMSRWILVIIPLVTCTVVLVAVFVVGNPQPRPAALLYGGPTSAESPLAWTVEVEHVGEGESTGPPYDGPIVVDVGMWRNPSDHYRPAPGFSSL